MLTTSEKKSRHTSPQKHFGLRAQHSALCADGAAVEPVSHNRPDEVDLWQHRQRIRRTSWPELIRQSLKVAGMRLCEGKYGKTFIDVQHSDPLTTDFSLYDLHHLPAVPGLYFRWPNIFKAGLSFPTQRTHS